MWWYAKFKTKSGWQNLTDSVCFSRQYAENICEEVQKKEGYLCRVISYKDWMNENLNV